MDQYRKLCHRTCIIKLFSFNTAVLKIFRCVIYLKEVRGKIIYYLSAYIRSDIFPSGYVKLNVVIVPDFVRMYNRLCQSEEVNKNQCYLKI